MPIAVFENYLLSPLLLVVEPSHEKYEVQHLSKIGVRYAVKEGEEDRSYSVVSNDQIEFWCNADSCEVQVMHPSAFRKLSWDICVNGGWCGGVVDGVPTTVDNLLPEDGIVTAREFAELVLRADGYASAEPSSGKYIDYICEKFAEHMHADFAHVDQLRPDVAVPFEPGS